VAALDAYADGRRESGIMQTIAGRISPESRRALAGYYAELPAPAPDRASADQAAVERGRLLAQEGDPEGDIPACMACHGEGALPAFPRLAGQNAAYFRSQLRLWRSGVITRTEGASIMKPIAERLTDMQIADAAAYFASLPRSGEETAP
jgi:cytochrome c553